MIRGAGVKRNPAGRAQALRTRPNFEGRALTDLWPGSPKSVTPQIGSRHRPEYSSLGVGKPFLLFIFATNRLGRRNESGPGVSATL